MECEPRVSNLSKVRLSDTQSVLAEQLLPFAVSLSRRQWKGKGIDRQAMMDYAVDCTLEAVQRFDPIRFEGASTRGFLACLVRKIPLQIRSRSIEPLLYGTPESLERPVSDRVNLVDLRDECERLRWKVRSFRARIYLRLRYEEGMSAKEIGHVFGKSRRAIDLCLNQAYREMRGHRVTS